MGNHLSEYGARGLIVAAPASGTGKTTVTLGLLAALRARGVAVAAAKVGPDYIDPAFHQAATGRASYNLDSWAMGPGLLDHLAARAGKGAELVVCEGVMGLFDGTALPGASGNGSAADVAARTGWPVVLVVDTRGQSQSAAALVSGFAGFRPDVRVAGVILNGIGSPRHLRLVGDAIADLGIPLLGALPRDPDVTLPERHLGLVQAQETGGLPARLDALGRLVGANVDLDRLMDLAVPARPPMAGGGAGPALPPLGQRIAVAQDLAFTFAYPHVLDGWRAAGAELLSFSPLANEPPPADADAVFLPGGYPELHAARIAAAERFHEGLWAMAATRPIYGECGGFMVLGESLEDASGTSHRMCGLLGVRTSFAQRRRHLGYRRAALLADGPLGRAGQVFGAHEFHYSSVTDPGIDDALFTATAADGSELGRLGARRGLVAGSFLHLIARHEGNPAP